MLASTECNNIVVDVIPDQSSSMALYRKSCRPACMLPACRQSSSALTAILCASGSMTVCFKPTRTWLQPTVPRSTSTAISSRKNPNSATSTLAGTPSAVIDDIWIQYFGIFQSSLQAKAKIRGRVLPVKNAGGCTWPNLHRLLPGRKVYWPAQGNFKN